MIEKPLDDVLLNINIPDVEYSKIKALRSPVWVIDINQSPHRRH